MSEPSTFRIAVARAFGGPEVITLEAHPVTPIPRGQVRVAVRAAGTNPVDARIRRGSFGGTPPLVFGGEFSGVVVDAAGSDAWHVGDEVVGYGASGAYADLVSADPNRLVRRPDDIDPFTAAGLNGVGQTALSALDLLDLPAGATLVAHGASGGVGTVLVQLAVARGLRVIGTASPANHDYLRELGAIPVAYGPGLAERISDAAGGPIAASIDLAGTTEAGDVAVQIARAGGRALTLVPETMQSHGLQLMRGGSRSTAHLAQLLAAVGDGALAFPVEAVPFTQVVEAHRRLDAAHARGKLVLDLSDNPHLPTIEGH